MAYLRLIKNKIQDWSETVSSALNIDVAVADKNLIRIAGTGDFYNRLEEVCPEDSLFAIVVKSGEPKINLIAKNEPICKNCSNYVNCKENANMSYPLIVDDETIGVISFASFDHEQSQIMNIKKNEYFDMLKQTAEMIEQEIARIKMTNRIKTTITEVNDLINCLNKGIIVINSNDIIININAKALEILGINVSEDKIMDSLIFNWITNIDLNTINKEDLVEYWMIRNDKIRVRYNINKIPIKDNDYYIMISFDRIKEIIDIAKTFENRKEILFENIIGKSKSILNPIEKAKIAAKKDSTILIRGESGTGKELVAKSIHNESLRKDGPFVAINVSGIPDTLIESELFGYEGGAFTGSRAKGKKGKVELANNGTLFLDEIGDLPIHLQTKLLRVLQERTIDKIGSDGETKDVNIRIIAATHRNLEELINEGMFRLDLYYRLNVIPINLPPLRERGEDIFLCSEYIIKNLSEKLNTKEMELSSEVKKLFKEYLWPGNLRELENVLEHCMCFCNSNVIQVEHLPEYFINNRISNYIVDTNISNRKKEYDNESIFVKYNIIDTNKNLEELKCEFEKDIIKKLIDYHGDTAESKKLISKKLDIGLSTLYKKMS